MFCFNKSLIVLFSLFLVIFEGSNSPVKARDNDKVFLRNIKISQDKHARGDVLISKPNPFDLKISTIFRSSEIKSLEQYSLWLQKNLEFTQDKGQDTWADPLESISRGYGDCEDFAFLNKAVLIALGYEAEVFSVVNFGANHAICVFKEGNSYSLFDNQKLIRTQAQSIEELALYAFSKYSGLAFARLSLATKTRDIMFRKSEMLG